MSKRSVASLSIVLLLVGSFTFLLQIQPATADGTIYIRADGSIDPPSAPIIRSGDVFTFNDDIYASIVVRETT